MAAMTPRLQSEQDGYQEGKQVINREYLVETTDPDDGSIVARSAVVALGIPVGYYYTSLTAEKLKDHPLWFRVKAAISSMPWVDNEPVPTARQGVRSTSYEERNESYFLDTNGKPAASSAHEKFEELPTRRTGSIILQFDKNLENFSELAMDVIAYTTNADVVVVKGVPYGTDSLLMAGPTSQEMIENVNGFKYHYYKVTFRIYVDATDHFHDFFDDRGYFQLDGDDQTPITLVKGKFVFTPNTPWPLNGSGLAKPKMSDVPAVLERVPYDSVSWGIDFD